VRRLTPSRFADNRLRLDKNHITSSIIVFGVLEIWLLMAQKV
jgi:hypothetical protein